MAGVFVSYRRDDVGMIASDVVGELQKELQVPVFFDLESIQSGEDFRQAIADALRGCDVILVLLGKDWYGPADRDRRRVDDPDDIFRNEVQTAIQSSAYLIPVLVGIQALDDETLGPVAALAGRQWHHIRLGQKPADIKALVDVVKQRLYERRQAKLGGDIGQGVKVEPYEARLPFHDSSVFQGETFSYTLDLNLRVNAALVAHRPLLIIGSTGSGSRGIARQVSHMLGWRYYEHVITSRFAAQDLLYRFDDTRRLHDAQSAERVLTDANYVEPGILWWGFDPGSARRRGLPLGTSNLVSEAVDPVYDRQEYSNAVVHIASLDKAKSTDIEDLFIVLGREDFFVVEAGVRVVRTNELLTIFTAESPRILERQGFERAIIYEMPFPTLENFVEIARTHFPDIEPEFIVELSDALQQEMDKRNLRRRPEVADFLDLLHILRELHMTPEGTNWRILLDSLGLLD